jgi:FlaA1/EpsC-like NDP-sugar epimerase
VTQLRNRHFFFGDLFLLLLASYLAFVLRLEQLDLGQYWPGFFLFTGLALVVTPVLFRRARIYSRYWRYASVGELFVLLGTVSAATVTIGLASILTPEIFFGSHLVPRSIPFIFGMLAVALTATPRFFIRLRAGVRTRQTDSRRKAPVLIAGAGDAGAMIMRELQQNPRLGMDAIGFVDDDPGKRGMRILGVEVLGRREDIPRLARAYRFRQVIIAMPTAPGTAIREIVGLCEKAGVHAQIIPGMYELLDGTVSVNQLREVNIEDLLRREPVRTDTVAIEALARGKRILVTGGGGSIGSELCRQIAQFEPAQLILVGHGENSIFYIQGELRRRFPRVEISVIIADVRDRARLRKVYEECRPEIVFHAAAHKHVPLMEANPCEAITNNVVGTRNLVELAADHGVAHFVLVSTDKAVNPTSVMGASKRCAELVVQHVAQETGRPYVAVRFGNVLGSRGSVVPFFKKQIAAGGPVTVTDPQMRRFFMTIPEAVQLVLQAAVLGKGGEVFVLDMGEPVRIVDLARDLIELSGLKPDEDIQIKFTGMRPGEKLFEELFIPGETYGQTHHEKIFVVQGATDEEIQQSRERNLEWLIDAAQRNDDEAIRPLLKLVVPEYSPEGGGLGLEVPG